MADDTKTNEQVNPSNDRVDETAKGTFQPQAGQNGELAVDTSARAQTINDNGDDNENGDRNIEEAKAQALQNHSVEHANDDVTNSGDKTAV
jgi:hypothetical protein